MASYKLILPLLFNIRPKLLISYLIGYTKYINFYNTYNLNLNFTILDITEVTHEKNSRTHSNERRCWRC